MTEKKRRGGGGKLARTEIVQVRLDPKLRYLAELAARKQRRTLSSFIEWAIEDTLNRIELYQGSGYNGDQSRTVADEISSLWDIDEAERFVRLAIRYPELLTHQEQEIWKLLKDSRLLSPASSRVRESMEWDWVILDEVVFPELRRQWPSLMTAFGEGTDSARKWVDEKSFDISVLERKAAEIKSIASSDDFDDLPF
jgi:hypothetical protein